MRMRYLDFGKLKQLNSFHVILIVEEARLGIVVRIAQSSDLNPQALPLAVSWPKINCLLLRLNFYE